MDETKKQSVQTVHGQQHVVVSGHHSATQTALQVLQEDGNIVDAALAGAAVLCSALPHACGIGGDCFIVLHQDGQSYSINGSGRSPASLPLSCSASQLARGPLSGSVPGMVGAWETLHQRFGSVPLPTLFQPAIDLARNGVEIASDLDNAFASHAVELEADAGCRALFMSSQARPDSGQVLFQPRLADTLSALARGGASALYQGELGQSLCRTVRERGGVLSVDDLVAYEPLWMKPLKHTYRGYDVFVPPPNSYALLMLLQLAALSNESLSASDIASAERLRLLITAARQAVAAGTPCLADPSGLAALDPAGLPETLVGQLQSVLSDSEKFVNSLSLLPRAQGTAVISVADNRGNGVSIIQSIFTPFGSHVADADTGILLNNRLLGFSTNPADLNFARPGQRPAHTLSPAMVLHNGKLRMLLSTPGGSGQTITLTQILTNMVDYGLSLGEATARARWSLDLQGNLLAESGVSQEIVEQLNLGGLPVTTAGPEHRFFFGSAECIHIGEDMKLTAVADYRRNAYAGGL